MHETIAQLPSPIDLFIECSNLPALRSITMPDTPSLFWAVSQIAERSDTRNCCPLVARSVLRALHGIARYRERARKSNRACPGTLAIRSPKLIRIDDRRQARSIGRASKNSRPESNQAGAPYLLQSVGTKHPVLRGPVARRVGLGAQGQGLLKERAAASLMHRCAPWKRMATHGARVLCSRSSRFTSSTCCKW